MSKDVKRDIKDTLLAESTVSVSQVNLLRLRKATRNAFQTRNTIFSFFFSESLRILLPCQIF